MKFHYREDIVEKFSEEGTKRLEEAFLEAGKERNLPVPSRYVIHRINFKLVVCGHFLNFINGYLFGKEEKNG